MLLRFVLVLLSMLPTVEEGQGRARALLDARGGLGRPAGCGQARECGAKPLARVVYVCVCRCARDTCIREPGRGIQRSLECSLVLPRPPVLLIKNACWVVTCSWPIHLPLAMPYSTPKAPVQQSLHNFGGLALWNTHYLLATV